MMTPRLKEFTKLLRSMTYEEIMEIAHELNTVAESRLHNEDGLNFDIDSDADWASLIMDTWGCEDLLDEDNELTKGIKILNKKQEYNKKKPVDDKLMRHSAKSLGIGVDEEEYVVEVNEEGYVEGTKSYKKGALKGTVYPDKDYDHDLS